MRRGSLHCASQWGPAGEGTPSSFEERGRGALVPRNSLYALVGDQLRTFFNSGGVPRSLI